LKIYRLDFIMNKSLREQNLNINFMIYSLSIHYELPNQRFSQNSPLVTI
jgi:hypothetical protein